MYIIFSKYFPAAVHNNGIFDICSEYIYSWFSKVNIQDMHIEIEIRSINSVK